MEIAIEFTVQGAYSNFSGRFQWITFGMVVEAFVNFDRPKSKSHEGTFAVGPDWSP